MIALVTGGGGFLGGAIVKRLLARGGAVRGFSRGCHPHLAEMGVEQFRGDLTDAAALARAVEGCGLVFHVAAKAGVWGPLESYARANTLGTKNVVSACLKYNVPRLVYTSTPSVTFDGGDENGVDESRPYARKPLCPYARTKAEAEQHVLSANCEALATVALRPHLIWGPGDNHLVPRIIARGKAGRLRLVGAPGKKVDSTYIDNAADAHLLAADRLAPDAACAGRAYYISNGAPAAMDDLLNRILEAGGLPPVTKRISAGLAYTAGAVLEALYFLAGKQDEPPMTRFVARQLSTAHWYDLSAAKRDLGYSPSISLDEGMRLLKEHLQSAAKSAG